MNCFRLTLSAIALVVAGAASAQQAAPSAAIRATIVSVADDGASLVVHRRSGETATIRLKPDARVALVLPASLADVKPGLFVGVAALPGQNGALNAMEVHIFPEAMRGAGEGFRPFDLAPGSSMTNGAIEARVDGVAGPKLTVTYKGGQQTIDIAANTPIVMLAPGARSDLKPG
ncbi:MAG: hypothetical protein JO107_07595, partial [Hyphomicrobiales bacterium]|nr:hypothetical protein [Hyphomicrobiales bacterium]